MAVYLIAVVLLIAAVTDMSSVLGPRHSDRETGEPFESGILPAGSARLHISARFHLIALFLGLLSWRPSLFLRGLGLCPNLLGAEA